MDFLAKMGGRPAINELYGGHIGGQIGVAFRDGRPRTPSDR